MSPTDLYVQDMNMGSDEGAGGGRNTSPYRKFSGGRGAGGGGGGGTHGHGHVHARSPARSGDWRSYDDRDDSSPVVGTTQRFEVDPNVPLEEMTVLGEGGPSDETESSDGGVGQVRHQGGQYFLMVGYQGELER